MTTMTTMTVTAATVRRTYGELLADGMFAGEPTTNLIIYCTREIAADAIGLENADTPILVDLDNGGNAVKVYLHQCDLDSGCCDVCGKWADSV